MFKIRVLITSVLRRSHLFILNRINWGFCGVISLKEFVNVNQFCTEFINLISSERLEFENLNLSFELFVLCR